MMPAVYGESWTLKQLLVLPNEYIYWSIQIVMYPFMTGLVAGAFVLSALYHLAGVQALKGISRFALVFSLALLPVANLPPLLFLQHPARAHYIFLTPHLSSAIAIFGLVVLAYAALVTAELWFIYRPYFVAAVRMLDAEARLGAGGRLRRRLFAALTLGSRDGSPRARQQDLRRVRILAAVGLPLACVMHGYAGFIFGSVKANALWMTPLMPVLFILSAVVSGIALCTLSYVAVSRVRAFCLRRRHARAGTCSLAARQLAEVSGEQVRTTARYLGLFLLLALILQLLDVIFRGYTAMHTWEVLRQVVYERRFFDIFVLQNGLGTLLPILLLFLPGVTVRRAVVASLLVLAGVFMMRWNVVIGGQSFSLSAAGFMQYDLPVLPRTFATLKEGAIGAMLVFIAPFLLLGILDKIFPVFLADPPEEGSPS